MKALLIILQLLPAILGGVLAVEQALPGAPGPTKKSVIMSAVGAGAKVGDQIPEDHVQEISALIDAVVGSLNQSGVFAKRPA